MLIAPVGLDIACEREIERNMARNYPIEDSTFHAFSVVQSSTGYTLLNLSN